MLRASHVSNPEQTRLTVYHVWLMLQASNGTVSQARVEDAPANADAHFFLYFGLGVGFILGTVCLGAYVPFAPHSEDMVAYVSF